jgi:alpha-beta hydrolase superfamily lysophospholipase
MASTVDHNSYFIESNISKRRLHITEWCPEGNTRGVIQLSHGMAEHIGRYGSFAHDMAAHGFISIGHDHVGHGKTAGEGELGHMCADHGWQEAASDLQQIGYFAHERFPGLPVFLFGHSMGSFLARTCLIDSPDLWQGCILSGTAWNSSIALAAGQAVIKLRKLAGGEHARSGLLNTIVFGSYNGKFKPNRTRHDWLSANEENVDRYLNDPYCGFIPSVGFFHSIIAVGFPYIQNQVLLQKMNKSLPVYFFAGTDDPVGNFGKGVERASRAFKDAGMADVTLQLYSGCRHEALHELKRAEVLEDLCLWLESKLALLH